MSKSVLRSDILLDDPRFLALGFNKRGEDFDEQSVVDLASFSLDRAMNILKDDPALGAAFLKRVEGSGSVYWTGDMSSLKLPQGGSVGVRVVDRRGGMEAFGENLFGAFLGRLRDEYRRYVAENVVNESGVRPGQVICDFTRKGEYVSVVEERERSGERFIHVDRYVPSRFRFDASRDGTTGHAERQSDADVPFHKFECPFGTSYPAPVIVESAAEASFLYERALRGELDWDALFDSLDARGLVGKGLTARKRDALIADLRSQFAWMREQVCLDRSLRELRIVAPSMLVADASLGRSIYDADDAPSPAHVLARYINNPLLLFSPALYSVTRSLVERDKNEPETFRLGEVPPEGVTLAVIGSDTIGGRDPGRKATSTNERSEFVDESGKTVIRTRKVFEIPMKTREEQEADYRAFSSRMDAVCAGIPDGVKVTFVTGNSSSLGDSVGLGTPQLLRRWVHERGGDVLKWDYFARKAVSTPYSLKGEDAAKARFSVILMDRFADVMPVVAGLDRSVSFIIESDHREVEVGYDAARCPVAGGAVCFSDTEDSNNRNVLALGSLAASCGLPVIHVQDNLVPEEQAARLKAGADYSRSFLAGDVVEEMTGVLRDAPRTGWDLGDANMMSYIDPETQIAVPFVTDFCAAPVLVGGFPFRSPLGVYVALVAHERAAASREELSRIAAAEGSTSELMDHYRAVLAGDPDGLDPLIEERLLRQAVRLVVKSNRGFADRLLDLSAKPIVMPVNGEDPTGLFVGLDGTGGNHFGVILADERRMMVEMRDARRLAAEEENRKVIEAAVKRQRLSAGEKAEGQKVEGGLPVSAEASRDAVWFLGTAQPQQLAIGEDQNKSFEMWDDENGDDPLVREKAARPYILFPDGDRMDNAYVYLFPSDLAAVTGRRRISYKSDSKDLTGVTRVDPVTGKPFVCAFGVPVRLNNLGNELDNPDRLPCSYRLDNDASHFRESVVLADSAARSAAIRHHLSLCLPGRYRAGSGVPYYTLGQVFMPKTYDRRERAFVANPHAAPLNYEIVNRYVKMLESGSRYPLNCICLPSASYSLNDQDTEAALLEGGERHVSPEGRFVADLTFALQVANATAVSLGVPLRFPLDAKGRIDLGPGVPEELRALAERKIDAFIGVTREEEIASGELPVLTRIPAYKAAAYRESMVKAGDVYLRPNDLVYPFGRYDFRFILVGQFSSLHDMSFQMEDGSVFKLVDAKTTRTFKPSELNEYLSYSKNGETCFIIKTNAPGRVGEFLSVLKGYIRRARAVRVEARLIGEREREAAGESLEGFVNLLSSNSRDYASGDDVREEYVDRTAPLTVGGVPFETLDGVAAAFLAGEVGKQTPALLERIRKAEAKGTGRALFDELKDKWAFEEASAAYRRAAKEKGEAVSAKEVAAMDYGTLVLRFKELVPGWDGDAAARKRAEAVRARADRRLHPTRTVTEKSHDIGREMDYLNGANRFDENDPDRVYWGWSDARDGFRGYAQIRYALPDGTYSEWKTVKDQELAGDIVMSMVKRTYRTDDRVVPDARVMEMFLTAEAVKMAGDRFRSTVFEREVGVEADDKVVRLEAKDDGKDPSAEAVTPREEKPRMNIYAGAGQNAHLSNVVSRPFVHVLPDGTKVRFDSVEQGFQYMKTYCTTLVSSPEAVGEMRRCILAAKGAGALRHLGASVPLDTALWDRTNEEVMLTLLRESFAQNPAAAEALLGTGDAELTHSQDQTKWRERFPALLMQVREELADGRLAVGPAPEREPGGGHLYVSYYGSRSIPEDAILVQTSVSCPDDVSVDVEFESVYPSYETMVAPHRDGTIDDEGYASRYRKDVLEANRSKILEGVEKLRAMGRDEGRDVYFLCYEKPGEFCHRYLLNNFLIENGIACRENPADALLYTEGRVRLLDPASVPEAPAVEASAGVTFTESAGGYAQRTRENAQADDVEFTFAFAADFDTYGERATERAAGESYVGVELPLVRGKGLDLSPKAVARAVDAIVAKLPDECIDGEPFGVNLAGNGLSTLAPLGVTQDQVDEFVCKVHAGLAVKGVAVSFYRSGGQTGVDEAAYALGKVFSLPVEIHAPKGYLFRDASGNDIRGRDAFMERFEGKDLQRLSSRVSNRQEPRQKAAQKKGGHLMA